MVIKKVHGNESNQTVIMFACNISLLIGLLLHSHATVGPTSSHQADQTQDAVQ